MARSIRDGAAEHAVVPRSPWLIALIALSLWIFGAAATGAQETVDVQADASSGYGRLILTFSEKLPEYTIRTTASVLVVTFDRAVMLDPSQMVAAMPEYVSAARRDPDGRSVRLALAQPATVNSMEAGEKLFLDLLPQGWSGLPPGLPQAVVDELARRAEETERRRAEKERLARLENAESVELRIGKLPTFTRFVFQWKEPVSARIERRLDVIRLIFDDFGKLNTAGLLSQLPPYVSRITAENGREGLEVELLIDPESSVRGFSEQATYVVDVGAPSKDVSDDAPGLPEVSATARWMTQLDGTTDPSLTNDEPVDHHPVRASLAPLRADEVERSVSGSSPPTANNEATEIVGVPDDDHQTTENEAVRIEARRFGESARLVFPFLEPTSSAVFEHAGALWLVFDTARPLDLRGIEHDLSGMVSSVDLMAAGERSVLRLVLERPLLTNLGSEGTSWVITIGDTMMTPPAPLELVRADGEANETNVTIDLPAAAMVHGLRDAEGGYSLSVVTAGAPAHGLVKPHNFVDFSAVPTFHGLAIRHVSDDLTVRLENNTVRVTRPGGLVLSPIGSTGAPRSLELLGSAVRPGFVDIGGGEDVLDPGVVHRLISGYLRAAATAKDDERTDARIRLAQALVATGLGAEGLGELQLIAQDEPATMRRADVRALRGVAKALMGRPKEALAEFDMYGLSQSTDIALWQGLAQAQLGDWREAAKSFARGEPALASYSPERQRMFGLSAARAGLELGNTAKSAVRLAQLRDLADSDDPELAFLEGLLAEALGDIRQAIKGYDLAIAEGRAPTAMEARLRRTMLRHRAGEIDDQQAIDELETLAVSWRGDEIELQTLRHLARLHAGSGNHRRAFELMKSATIIAPDSSITRALQDEMNLAFQDLFLDGGADDLPPIKALALYYDFRELTPIGRKGDEVIRWLANRLVEVDLLEHAAELLTHQVEHRLSGAARAQVAARLALIHLMNHKPARALTVLARTRQAVLPREVANQRALLEARALSETGRSDLALDLLNSLDDGPEVLRLRADILWQAERWQDAGEAYESVLGDIWHAARALDRGAQYDVLRAAIAYALAEDELGLDRLRAKFLGQMAESDKAGAFEAVTRAPSRDGREFRALVNEVAGLDTLDAFLREYSARYNAPDAKAAPQS